LKEYDQQEMALKEMENDIITTIDLAYRSITFNKGAPGMMRAVQEQFKPTDFATKRDILKEYKKNTKAQKRDVDIDKWLVSLEKAYEDGIRNQVSEINSNSAVYDFLDSLSTLAPDFVALYDMQVAQVNIPAFKEILRVFRNWRRNRATRPKAQIQHSAFGASFQGLDSNGNPVDKSGDTPPSRTLCLCGRKHPWHRCFYLNRDIRPSWWRPNAYIQSSIDKKLKNTELKSKVNLKPAALSTDLSRQYEYELHDSFIFAAGATGHVCNNRSRLVNFRPAKQREFCVARNECIEIEGWGSVTLRTECTGYPNGREITLTNVALIRSFHCSVVSFEVLNSQGNALGHEDPMARIRQYAILQDPSSSQPVDSRI
jgi:hypothetical protein